MSRVKETKSCSSFEADSYSIISSGSLRKAPMKEDISTGMVGDGRSGKILCVFQVAAEMGSAETQPKTSCSR
jgi:hypothetical protein